MRGLNGIKEPSMMRSQLGHSVNKLAPAEEDLMYILPSPAA